jgi:phosphohistidine phosphatase
MKYLFLLRHGDAPRAQHESDSDRKLSTIGYREAEQVAEFIHKNNLNIDLIKSSDSIRTRQTVSKLLESYSQKPKTIFTRDLYNVSGYEILDLIKSTESSINNLMVVGHNPGITSILDLINPQGSSEDILKSRNYEVTCKLVIIACNISDWSELDITSCKFQSVFYP